MFSPETSVIMVEIVHDAVKGVSPSLTGGEFRVDLRSDRRQGELVRLLKPCGA